MSEWPIQTSSSKAANEIAETNARLAVLADELSTAYGRWEDLEAQ